MEQNLRTCRICKSKTISRGLLEVCSDKSCKAVFWDKFAVRKRLYANKETAKEASPHWVQDLLSEAEVPASVKGEYYVYTLKLRKNLPKKTSPRLRERMPNNGHGRFYVGMTSRHPFERYLNHIRGYKASWAAKRMSVAMTGFEGPMTYLEAKEREPLLAKKLIEQGYDIHGGH